MNAYESIGNHEKPKVEKQEVISSYKKFLEKGSPDNFDLEDPEIKKAQELYDTYFAKQRATAQGDKEAECRVNFEQTMFYLDAGFTDPDYVEDVLLDFAQQDIDDAEKEFPKLAEEMRTRVEEYKKKLISSIE